MSIKGNVVGNLAPRSNYAQEDPTSAEFIKNKPVEAIQKAQKTADDALPKAGGKMTGDIAMSGKRVTGLGDPVEDGDAANKGYVDGTELRATLSATGWSSSAPYTQTVAVAGITADDNPDYWPVYSGSNDNRIAQKAAFVVLDHLETAAGTVTVTCFEEKPETDITIGMEVHR